MKTYNCKKHGPQEPYVWVNPKTGDTHRWCPTCRKSTFEGREAYSAEWRDQNREHRATYMLEYRRRHAAKLRARRKEDHAALRQRIVRAYGGKCACCEVMEPGFLTIDHINSDGHLERKQSGSDTPSFYRRIETAGYPKDRYRLLCFNCNLGRARSGGVCPHEYGPRLLASL
jgi:hypothetical protein